MIKLIIQIPCYNEEDALPLTLSALPRKVPGVQRTEWLVIDDGSSDQTVAVAQDHGVDHIIRLPRHQGLARAFIAGLEASLEAGADIIVNTDADNQYCAADIPKLIEPILNGQAQMVIGSRPIAEITHFSAVKKLLQKIGSRVTRMMSQTDVQDAPSGFRAFSREAAMRVHVFNEHTYTIETIIQAGQIGMPVTCIPIRTNQELRPSRLVKSLWGYVNRQLLTILRISVRYKPFGFFAMSGAILFTGGVLISLRFLYFYVLGSGSGHIQSGIFSALLMGVGFFLCVVGLLADLISVNRKLLEGLDWRIRKIEDKVNALNRSDVKPQPFEVSQV